MNKEQQLQFLQNANRQEVIDFAKQFNIYKSYTFPDYVDVKDAILQKMSDLDIQESEIQVVRVVNEQPVTYVI